MSDLFITQNQMVLDYMEKKYSTMNDSFEIVNAERSGSNMKRINTLYLTCKSIPNYTIIVNLLNDEISDTYMEQKILLEYEKRVTDYYQKIFGDVKVICQPAYYPTAFLDQNTSLDDYLLCGKYKINEHIIMSSKDSLDNIEMLFDFFKEKFIPHESVYIKILNDKKMLKEINDYQSMRRLEKEKKALYSNDIIYILSKNLEIIKKRGGYFQ